MMGHLDMRTMLQVGAMVCLTLVLVMIYYSCARKTYPGFQYWTAGIVGVGIGAVLISMRKLLPNYVTIVLGNFLVVLMPFLLTYGLTIFLNIKWKLAKLSLITVVIFLIFFVWWTYIDPSLCARIVCLSLVMGFFFAQALYIATKFVPLMLETHEWALVTALAISTSSSLFRAIATCVNTTNVSFINNPAILQSMSLLMTILSIVACACSLLILNSHRMEIDLKAAKSEIEKLVNIDALSTLYNRRYFNTKLIDEFKRNRRSSSPLSLIMLDIDFFKLYNDTYGHQAGDKCIQEVASILQDSGNRSSDITARYGGEEFVVLLPNTDSAGARSVAELIQDRIKSRGIQHETSPVAPFVTLTIGIASFTPDRSTSPEKLITLADQELYKGKNNGRNQINCSGESTKPSRSFPAIKTNHQS